MSFTAPFTATTGAVYTAAQFNTYTRDNFNALWVGTTAGDIDYYTSASAKNRLANVAGGVLTGGASAPAWLAKPASADSFLKGTSAGSISWRALTGMPHTIHDWDSVEKSTTFGTNSTSLVDVTGVTFNLSLDLACTIYAFAFGSYTLSAAYIPQYSISIDGVSDTLAVNLPYENSWHHFSTLKMAASVAAGVRTIKLQAKTTNALSTVTLQQCRMAAIAIVE
jgi:hypothetical protein